MEVFGGSATNSSQPVSGVFADAVGLVDGKCGAEFVNATVGASSSSAAATAFGGRGSGSGGLGLLALGAAMVVVAL